MTDPREPHGLSTTQRAGLRTLPVTRRAALKTLAAAAAAPGLAACQPGEDAPPTGAPAGPSNPLAAGTASDPDLLSPTTSWDPVLGPDEMQTVVALCDVILPADERSPSASQVGVHEFIQEWVSAPYEANRSDRIRIRGGLAWLNREATERFESLFWELTPDRQRAICDDICYVPDAAPEFRHAALFFDRFRDLVATGFWTTEEGMQDLQFIGNVPTPTFEGPPPEVLERLGLA